MPPLTTRKHTGMIFSPAPPPPPKGFSPRALGVLPPTSEPAVPKPREMRETGMRVISPATMGVPTTVLASTASRIRWMVSDMSSLTGWFFSMVCFPFPFRGGGGRLLALFSTVANGFHHRPPQGEDNGQQLGYRQ